MSAYRDLPNLTSPLATAGITSQQVMPGDEPGAMEYTQPFVVALDNYAAAAFSNTNPTYTSAYYVGDTGFKVIGDNVLAYTRRWRTVPAAWVEYESQAFTYPGKGAGWTSNSYNVNALSVSNNVASLTTTLTPVSTGDVVHVSLKYTYGGLQYSTATWAVVDNTATNTVNVRGALFSVPSGSASNVTGTIRVGYLGRSQPKTITVTARVQHEYAYSTSPDTNFPPAQQFRPVDTAGEDVTVLTTTTIPTANVYQTLVQSYALLCADSRVERWAGNIYHRRTRWVPAQ